MMGSGLGLVRCLLFEPICSEEFQASTAMLGLFSMRV